MAKSVDNGRGSFLPNDDNEQEVLGIPALLSLVLCLGFRAFAMMSGGQKSCEYQQRSRHLGVL